ncbi:FGGY-family carbohydrate kinase [Tropicibacter naphthalenivorans]|uniref:Xylulokinase n=1 Tax=Tropicibacter naphthalenivorans TaxID=441103 RepID=A0A0P1GK66_9RHOB|nr:FGGY-family carbohydrate kinase [Tropicibacter naphthalenivorans]CUH82439.1 xylulokinase [Tropicibacter naphthalenivorans]SMD06142.1 Sugar (pentulose or hexulose) kinase [Tropicibacter naphthalenivorans]
MSEVCTIGIDLGTSGVRAVAVRGQTELARADCAITGDARRDPLALFATVRTCLSDLGAQRDLAPEALAIAGTSGSLVPVSATGQPCGEISLYNAKADVAILALLESAPGPALGPCSTLARAIALQRTGAYVVFETDYIAGRLAGARLPADMNNALKCGVDPQTGHWPRTTAPLDPLRMPELVPPGQPVADMRSRLAKSFGFHSAPLICAGTTDGCASALAAGLERVGDAVTSLGSTLTIKMLSDTPITSAQHGIYSHLLLGHWLVGGASNAGGAVLRQFFDDARLADLGAQIDPEAPTGLRYTPLLTSGERFPTADPYLMPCFTPRPDCDSIFLQGMLEALVQVEAAGFQALRSLGAPPLRRLFAVGGGLKIKGWNALRHKYLPFDHHSAHQGDAAFGAARLARFSMVTERPQILAE